MLADAAAVHGGKLFIHGGSWDSIFAATIPTTHPKLAVALVLEAEWSESHQERTLDVALHDDDENPLGVAATGVFNVGHPPTAIHGQPILTALALEFAMVQFPTAGRYHFIVKVDGQELSRVAFNVRPLSPGLTNSGAS